MGLSLVQQENGSTKGTLLYPYLGVGHLVDPDVGYLREVFVRLIFQDNFLRKLLCNANDRNQPLNMPHFLF